VTERPPPTPPDGAYRWYVLGVLVLVYVFNFLDRNILSILAERIKGDLGLSDDQMGFLYGTAFAVFYAIFGIPLGRLADVWDRRRLISIGLAVWSAMTALSGVARGFGELAGARIGVGVGEASANPAAYSKLSDWFPASMRATVLALYSTGIYIGGGIGIFLGGLIVERWDRAYPGATAPFGLHGWQVAFFLVGLPGLLLSLWVRSLREPVRGLVDGFPAPPVPHPFREFARELAAVIPPATLFSLKWRGAGRATLAANVVGAALLAAAALALTRLLGAGMQWGALAVGLYTALSWVQGLRLRDPAAFALVFGSRALILSCVGFAFLAFTGYAYALWTPPYFLRELGVKEGQLGLVLGLTAAGAGFLGVSLGGLLADRLRASHPNGRLRVGLLAAVLTVPVAVAMLSTRNVGLAYALNFPLALCSSMWIGPGASTVQDLVLPRMRASASAFYLLVVTFIGLALGPYSVGRASVALGSLRSAMLVGLGANALAFLFLVLAGRRLPADEASRLARARAAGEPGV
jgi:MFS family permease